jgi:hypothetical protein
LGNWAKTYQNHLKKRTPQYKTEFGLKFALSKDTTGFFAHCPLRFFYFDKKTRLFSIKNTDLGKKVGDLTFLANFAQVLRVFSPTN